MTYVDALNKIMVDKRFEHSVFVSNNRFYYKNYPNWHECILIEDVITFFHCEVLDFCGCGCPEDTQMSIYTLLKIKDNDALSYDDKRNEFKERLGLSLDEITGHGIWQFMLYYLDKVGIVEHGSSIGGCYLTEFGKVYLSILEEWIKRGTPDF